MQIPTRYITNFLSLKPFIIVKRPSYKLECHDMVPDIKLNAHLFVIIQKIVPL
jgi:hypothetical protein